MVYEDAAKIIVTLFRFIAKLALTKVPPLYFLASN